MLYTVYTCNYTVQLACYSVISACACIRPQALSAARIEESVNTVKIRILLAYNYIIYI